MFRQKQPITSLAPVLIVERVMVSGKLFLTWGHGARVNNISGLLLELFVLLG